MKNSSRLFAEIDRNRSRSSSGWSRLADSSSTRRLKLSQDSSRLMKRSGLAASSEVCMAFRPLCKPLGGLQALRQDHGRVRPRSLGHDQP